MTTNVTGVVKDTATGVAFPGQPPILAVPSLADHSVHACNPWLGCPDPTGEAPALSAPVAESLAREHRECADRVVGYTRVLPWCSGGHEPKDHPEDRTHYGYTEQVDATLMPLVEAWDGQFVYAQVEAFVAQHDRAAEPHINFGKQDERGIELTEAEARQAAAVLVKLADQIAGAR